jgi:hypothetical protein
MGIRAKIWYAYPFVLLLRAVIWIGVCFFCATEWLEFFIRGRFFYGGFGFELLEKNKLIKEFLIFQLIRPDRLVLSIRALRNVSVSIVGSGRGRCRGIG